MIEDNKMDVDITSNAEMTGIEIAIDPEPAGLQRFLALLFLIISIFGCVIATSFTTEGVCSPLAIFAGVILGAVAVYIADKLLKPRWSSGRFLRLTPQAIAVVFKEQLQISIDPTAPVNVLMWYFKISRRTRVPKGWYVIAIALEQDDNYLPVYALISPQTLETFPFSKQFVLLPGRKERKNSQNEGGLRQAGMIRRLQTAETYRNMEGVEMTIEDFEVCFTHLQKHYPTWMPLS